MVLFFSYYQEGEEIQPLVSRSDYLAHKKYCRRWNLHASWRNLN